jgi:hypothetical protein
MWSDEVVLLCIEPGAKRNADSAEYKAAGDTQISHVSFRERSEIEKASFDNLRLNS